MSFGTAVVARKRHKGQVDGVEHDFDRHEHNQDVAPRRDADQTDGKKDRAQYQQMRQRDRSHGHPKEKTFKCIGLMRITVRIVRDRGDMASIIQIRIGIVALVMLAVKTAGVGSGRSM